MIEGEEDSFETWQGLRGPYYTPHIDENGNLTWTNNGGLQNPPAKNITGPEGKGLQISGIVAEVSELPETAESGTVYLVGTESPYEGQGPQGDPFTYSDFTQEQLAALTGPQGPEGPDGPAGPPGIIVQTTQPSTDEKVWLNPDDDTLALVPEVYATTTTDVYNMGDEYLSAESVYDRTLEKTQAEINNGGATRLTAFQNNWSVNGLNFVARAGNRRHLHLSIRYGTTTDGTTICTLPADAPVATALTPIFKLAGAFNGYLSIDTNGTVKITGVTDANSVVADLFWMT